MVQTPAPPRRVLSRPLLPLASVTALTGVGYALAGPFLSLFLVTELRVGPVALGAFLLVESMAALVVSTLVGRLSDARAVRRTLLVVGGAAGSCGYALFAVVRDYWVLLAVSTTLAAVAASLMPQMFAYARQAVERTGSARAPLAISGLRTLISVCWVAGPPLAAVLVAERGFGGLFAVSAAVYAVAAVAAAVFLPELGPHTPRASGGPAEPALRAEVVLAALAFVALQGAGMLGVLAMPLLVTGELAGSTRDAGLVLGLCAALEIPLMPAFGALAMRVDRRRLVCAGAVFALAYHGLVPLTQDVWQVAAAQVLNAVVIAAVMGVGISYFQDLAPDRPGYATTLYTNTTKVSSMIAGPLLGLSQHFGYRWAYLFGLALSVCGLVLLLSARPRSR